MTEAQLSTPEIDQLLSAFTGGHRKSTRLTEIERLDISRPTPIPKGIFESLVILHEQASYPLSEELRLTLGRSLEVKLVDVAQNTFDALQESIPDTCCAFVYRVDPLRQPAYLIADFEFAYACIDRLLGGSGMPSGRPRELTPTEVTVLASVLEPVVQSQMGVWSRFTDLTPSLQKMVSIRRYLREIRPSDGVLTARYRCDGFPEGTGFQFIMPLPELETSLQHPPKVKPRGPEQSKERLLIEGHLREVDVEMSVGMGSAMLTVGDVLSLEEGDVVVLNRGVREEVDLLVEGQSKFKGQLLRQGKGACFRINKSLDDKPGGGRS